MRCGAAAGARQRPVSGPFTITPTPSRASTYLWKTGVHCTCMPQGLQVIGTRLRDGTPFQRLCRTHSHDHCFEGSSGSELLHEGEFEGSGRLWRRRVAVFTHDRRCIEGSHLAPSVPCQTWCPSDTPHLRECGPRPFVCLRVPRQHGRSRGMHIAGEIAVASSTTKASCYIAHYGSTALGK